MTRMLAPERHSGLIFANLTTLAHFAVSSARSLPKPAGESLSTVPPKSAIRIFTFGSSSNAFTSTLSLLTMSAGVFLGAPMPWKALAS